MGDNIDLNIENYDLNDLLNLFKLDYNFGENELRRSKKQVMLTHPDKSNMKEEYFLFFVSAFKILCSIHEFRTKSNISSTAKIVYGQQSYSVDKDEHREELLKSLMNKPNFNKLFNDIFDKYKLYDEDKDDGYGEWLKGDDGIDTDTRTNTMSQMNSAFDAKKNERKNNNEISICDYNNVGSSHYELSRERPNIYSADVFGALPYDDIRKAYMETIIPVSQNDYNRRRKFNNVDDMKKHSDYNSATPLTVEEVTDILNKQKYADDINDVSRAFKLVKQDEQSKKINDDMMRQFKTLSYT